MDYNDGTAGSNIFTRYVINLVMIPEACVAMILIWNTFVFLVSNSIRYSCNKIALFVSLYLWQGDSSGHEILLLYRLCLCLQWMIQLVPRRSLYSWTSRICPKQYEYQRIAVNSQPSRHNHRSSEVIHKKVNYKYTTSLHRLAYLVEQRPMCCWRKRDAAVLFSYNTRWTSNCRLLTAVQRPHTYTQTIQSSFHWIPTQPIESNAVIMFTPPFSTCKSRSAQ